MSILTFMSLIHFEFIFVCGIKQCCNFTLLYVVDQFSEHHLLKSLSFLHCIVLPPSSLISITSDMQMTPPLWQKVKN